MASGPDIRPFALARDYLLRYRGRFAAGFLLLLITNILALSVPRLLKHAVDALQASDRRRVGLLCLAIVGVAIAQGIVRTASRLAILGASRLVAYDLRGHLFGHLQRLPLAWYARRSIGDVTSRAVNDMLLVRSLFGPGMMNLVNTTFVYVLAVSMMLAMDARLTLIALAPYPIFLLAVNRLSRRIYGRTMAVQEQLGSLTARAQETISGIQLIRTYAREAHEARAWETLSRSYLDKVMSLARARGAMVPLMGSMASAGTLVVIGLGGRDVIAGHLSLGDFVAFNAYLAYLVWPTFAFGWILNTFQRGAAALGRISEVLAEPAEAREPVGAEAGPPLRGEIEVRDLTFAHDGAPAGVAHLRDVSLAVPAGGTLGILGTVGAGKSTLVNMLARVVDPPPGTVRIDGVDVREIPLGRLRRDVAMVPQEAFLFSRTLRQNVALAAAEIPEERLQQAVETSRLSKDLPLFPQGLDTLVGERGITLSGGQRQRATIARALAAGPRVLVLDDALSSLDAEVERDVVEGLRSMKGRSTLIVVSHRVAALSWADEILVMDQGGIVARGTHDQLVQAGGLYAEIARRQSLTAWLESA
jgi:ATP-binding cassette subfamily B multidrug efflux pump